MQKKSNTSSGQIAGQTATNTDGFGYATDDIPITEEEINKQLAKNYDMNAFKSNMAKLTGAGGLDGFKLAKDGILTGPDGKKYDTKGMGSSAGMVSNGIPKNIADAAMAKADKESKEAERRFGAYTAATGFSEGGGGSGASGAGSGEEGIGAVLPGAGAGTRDPASSPFAGLSKNYNGEQIGVAQDNIFNMMTRRYKLKDKQDMFY